MRTYYFNDINDIDVVENIISEHQAVFTHVEFVSWIGGVLILACMQ